MKESTVVLDRIYGAFRIKEPVLVDLIKRPEVERLKGISQLGVPDEYLHIKGFSRHEHSLGVMLLLRVLGASEEEQVAGLLHDVSHTAFSHVYDWVVRDYSIPGPKEDEQDKMHFDFICSSGITETLQRHNLDPKVIADFSRFKLLEQDLPNLCADRVDYSLRQIPLSLAHQVLRGLAVEDGIIVCGDKETAALYGRVFLRLQQEVWGGCQAITRYSRFSEVLRRSLDLGIISQNDFFNDEGFIVGKLKGSEDVHIQNILAALKNPQIESLGGGTVRYKKFRHIDPHFKNGIGLMRLSEMDFDFKKLLEEAREENEKGVLVDEAI